MAESKKKGAAVPPDLGKVADDIPLPTERTDYPWPRMEPGQSTVQPAKASSSARSFVEKYRPGWKVREEALKDFPGYIRIWFYEDPDVELPVDFKEVPGGLDRDEAAEAAAARVEDEGEEEVPF